MDLQDFIKDSLLSIHSGLKEVNKELTKHYDEKHKKNIFLLQPGPDAENIEGGVHFDVAVAAKQEIQGSKKGSFAIKVLGAELGQEKNNVEENLTRLKFTVNVTKWIGTYK